MYPSLRPPTRSAGGGSERRRQPPNPATDVRAKSLPPPVARTVPLVQEKTLVREKTAPPKPTAQKRTRRDANGSAQMLIKRSVSPDGRIDSVSVEFSMPVAEISNGEIKDKALKILQLQKEIVGAFPKLNGEKASANNAATPAPIPQGNQRGSR